MDNEASCYGAVKAALDGDAQPALRVLRASGVRVAVGPRPAAALPGALHILCRRSDDGSHDPLEAGAPVTPGRGYFSHPPAAIHVMLDGPGMDEGGGRAAVASLLTHELSHAVDALVHGLDLRACGQLACSEVRAAAAAECAAVWPSFLRRRCTSNLAGTSADMVFPPPLGRACVAAVFDACYGGAVGDNPRAAGSAFARVLAQDAARAAAGIKA
jgi:hypothetical protein